MIVYISGTTRTIRKYTFASIVYELLNPGSRRARESVEKSSYDSFTHNGSLSRQICVSCPDDVGVVSLGYA